MLKRSLPKNPGLVKLSLASFSNLLARDTSSKARRRSLIVQLVASSCSQNPAENEGSCGTRRDRQSFLHCLLCYNVRDLAPVALEETTDDILRREHDGEAKISRKGRMLHSASFTVSSTRTKGRPRRYLSKPPCTPTPHLKTRELPWFPASSASSLLKNQALACSTARSLATRPRLA